jgi:acyl-CoA thioesterase-1
LGDNFEDDYKQMIANFLNLPTKPKLYVMVPPPLYPPNPYMMNKTVINDVFPILIRKIASETGAEPQVIDIFNALGGANLTQPNITCDGCHPRDAGYVEIAQTIAKTLTGQEIRYDPAVHGQIEW